MYTTLWQLNEKYHKKHNIKTIIFEMKFFVVIFFIVLLFIFFITNAQLFFIDNIIWEKTINNYIKNDDVVLNIKKQSINEELEVKKTKEIINKYKSQKFYWKNVAISLASSLKQKSNNFNFKFNTLPPKKRLIIKNINIDVPIVDSTFIWSKKFNEWNFANELEKWVVKYPTTKNPWEWHTLIFWHTSVEFWDHNKYWTVFKNIPNLNIWNIIEVIRNWKKYEYKIIEKNIIYPKNVNKLYEKYKNWNYLSIMWCYPIWKSTKRIFITSKLINKF